MAEYDFLFKLLLIGDRYRNYKCHCVFLAFNCFFFSGVGKSCLLLRFAGKQNVLCTDFTYFHVCSRVFTSVHSSNVCFT